MPKDMRELIETRKTPSEELKKSWTEISDKLKIGGGTFGSKLFHFSKSLERAGIDNHKFERARKVYEKAGDDLTDALHDIMKKLGI
jgi:hypothetical protein